MRGFQQLHVYLRQPAASMQKRGLTRPKSVERGVGKYNGAPLHELPPWRPQNG